MTVTADATTATAHAAHPCGKFYDIMVHIDRKWVEIGELPAELKREFYLCWEEFTCRMGSAVDTPEHIVADMERTRLSRLCCCAEQDYKDAMSVLRQLVGGEAKRDGRKCCFTELMVL